MRVQPRNLSRLVRPFRKLVDDKTSFHDQICGMLGPASRELNQTSIMNLVYTVVQDKVSEMLTC